MMNYQEFRQITMNYITRNPNRTDTETQTEPKPIFCYKLEQKAGFNILIYITFLISEPESKFFQ